MEQVNKESEKEMMIIILVPLVIRDRFTPFPTSPQYHLKYPSTPRADEHQYCQKRPQRLEEKLQRPTLTLPHETYGH
ncbi:hypothetical protein JTE90_004613 [Oedothorax gibbosus]|uniref:Uncharacterized protein n=1 Tax=Oedothorax gibbosus TaxID=931172 RepID=A0AAV6URT5_9ARAC|nr:hypothetical protein JTE90_004613 [Oedothorax gibbosus]